MQLLFRHTLEACSLPKKKTIIPDTVFIDFFIFFSIIKYNAVRRSGHMACDAADKE